LLQDSKSQCAKLPKIQSVGVYFWQYGTAIWVHSFRLFFGKSAHWDR